MYCQIITKSLFLKQIKYQRKIFWVTKLPYICQSANFRLKEVASDKWTVNAFWRWQDQNFEGPFNGIAWKKSLWNRKHNVWVEPLKSWNKFLFEKEYLSIWRKVFSSTIKNRYKNISNFIEILLITSVTNPKLERMFSCTLRGKTGGADWLMNDSTII